MNSTNASEAFAPAHHASMESLGEWPANGLQRVETCPICGSKEREIFHDKLTDTLFYCAPGNWTAHRCLGCFSLYLDPRPTAETLPIAYRTYYTHKTVDLDAPALERSVSCLSQRILAAHINKTYGAAIRGALPGGDLALAFLKRQRTKIDRRFRYLPRKKGRVLDVGFGGGGFLRLARDLGWQVCGVDIDPGCVAQAKALSIDAIEGDLQAVEARGLRFDVVTMAHSLEHVPHPYETLRTAFRVLTPGGQIFIEVPNVDALGHERFGRNWLGLDPPRHLVVFSAKGLGGLVERAGFVETRFHSYPDAASWMWPQSAEIEARTEGNAGGRPVKISRGEMRKAMSGGRDEVLIITARRPD